MPNLASKADGVAGDIRFLERPKDPQLLGVVDDVIILCGVWLTSLQNKTKKKTDYI